MIKYLDKVWKIKGRPDKEQSRNYLILTDLKLGNWVIYLLLLRPKIWNNFIISL